MAGAQGPNTEIDHATENSTGTADRRGPGRTGLRTVLPRRGCRKRRENQNAHHRPAGCSGPASLPSALHPGKPEFLAAPCRLARCSTTPPCCCRLGHMACARTMDCHAFEGSLGGHGRLVGVGDEGTVTEPGAVPLWRSTGILPVKTGQNGSFLWRLTHGQDAHATSWRHNATGSCTRETT